MLKVGVPDEFEEEEVEQGVGEGAGRAGMGRAVQPTAGTQRAAACDDEFDF